MTDFSALSSGSLAVIAAKSNLSDKTDKRKWLPFIIHSMDTAGIMIKLFNQWLPVQVKNELERNIKSDKLKGQLAVNVKNFCRLLALLHDTGKLTPAFQGKISYNIEGYIEIFSSRFGIELNALPDAKKSPHNVAGQAILKDMNFPDEISEIIGSHHGRSSVQNFGQIINFPSNYFGRKKADEKFWRGLWKEWISFALSETDFTLETLPKPDVKSQMILSGLLIMADWIASNTDYFPYIETQTLPDKSKCRARVNYAWDKFNPPPVLVLQSCCNSPEIFKERFEFKPYSLQRHVMKTISDNPFSGLYIIEAPMGLGKTEAALAAAEILMKRCNAGGIYLGLPTQATANGIFTRIKNWASKCDTEMHSIRLAHGMTELNDEYQAMLNEGKEIRQFFQGTASVFEDYYEDENKKDSDKHNIFVHEWFEGRKQALLSDFVIGTIDQFLLASLKQRHVMLRHLGLSGKVVILDECHAYDAYMNIYLDHTLTWMGAYNVPVIVLSATLPPERRDEMIRAYTNSSETCEVEGNADIMSYPVLTYVSKDKKIKREAMEYDIPEKKISVENLPEENLSFYLKDKLREGGCGAVIVNTVAYAQELAERLKSELPDFEIKCFHSRFIATDRAEIEKDLLKRVGRNSTFSERNKLIVVGTQVIEQSLDLDFDVMVSELCPMDLLLQRSGRLHRHERVRPKACEKPVLSVLKTTEEQCKKNTLIYSEWILEQTARYLPETLVIPSCIPELVSKVYASATPDISEQNEAYKKYLDIIENKKYNAGKYCIRSNMLKSRRKNLLSQFLDNDAGNSAQAEASVRDTDETFEVLVLREESENCYALVSTASRPFGLTEYKFDTTMELSENEYKLIARERLRLPFIFGTKYNFERVMNELKPFPKRWRNAKLLKGESLLLLDKDLKAELIEKELVYSHEFGLKLLK